VAAAVSAAITIGCAVLILAAGPSAASFHRGKELLGVDTKGRVFPDGAGLLLDRSVYDDPNPGLLHVFANGRIDRGFGDHGLLAIECADTVVQPDGKILVLSNGEFPQFPGSTNPVVARFLPDGRPDRSFGREGAAEVDFGRKLDFGDAIALTDGGRIAVAGLSANHIEERFGFGDGIDVVARLMLDGAPDGSFSGDGVARLQPDAESASVSGLAAGPHGTLVVTASQFEEGSLFVDRLLSNGNPDRSFGEQGQVAISLFHPAPGDEFLDAVDEVGVLPSGKILLVGTAFAKHGRYSDLLAIRLRRDGHHDRSYGRHGIAKVRLLHGGNLGTAFAVGRGGELLAATDESEPRTDLVAFAFNSGGKIDRRFGQRGAFRVSVRGYPDLGGIALRPSGRAVLGAETDLDPHPNRTVLALTPPLPRRAG
jgi:uncharacterized delta-60 repeat protein